MVCCMSGAFARGSFGRSRRPELLGVAEAVLLHGPGQAEVAAHIHAADHQVHARLLHAQHVRAQVAEVGDGEVRVADVDAVAVERVDGGLALLGTAGRCRRGRRPKSCATGAPRTRTARATRCNSRWSHRRQRGSRRCPVVLGGESEGGRPARASTARREEGRRHADHCEDVVLLDQRARQVGVLRRRTASSRAWP